VLRDRLAYIDALHEDIEGGNYKVKFIIDSLLRRKAMRAIKMQIVTMSVT